jgi:hypothetical protein
MIKIEERRRCLDNPSRPNGQSDRWSRSWASSKNTGIATGVELISESILGATDRTASESEHKSSHEGDDSAGRKAGSTPSEYAIRKRRARLAYVPAAERSGLRWWEE